MSSATFSYALLRVARGHEVRQCPELGIAPICVRPPTLRCPTGFPVPQVRRPGGYSSLCRTCVLWGESGLSKPRPNPLAAIRGNWSLAILEGSVPPRFRGARSWEQLVHAPNRANGGSTTTRNSGSHVAGNVARNNDLPFPDLIIQCSQGARGSTQRSTRGQIAALSILKPFQDRAPRNRGGTEPSRIARLNYPNRCHGF